MLNLSKLFYSIKLAGMISVALIILLVIVFGMGYLGALIHPVLGFVFGLGTLVFLAFSFGIYFSP